MKTGKIEPMLTSQGKPRIIIGCDFANGNDTTVIVRHHPDGTIEVVHASIKEISDIIGGEPIEARVSIKDRLAASFRKAIKSNERKAIPILQETIIVKEDEL